jgi:hypothetical protein
MQQNFNWNAESWRVARRTRAENEAGLERLIFVSGTAKDTEIVQQR